MIHEIDKIIDKKYEEIKESGKILEGIEKCIRDIRYKEPELAEYIKKKLMQSAKKNGDLP